MPGTNLLNNILRNLRERAFPRETQASVAKMLGIPNSYLSKVERGGIACPDKDKLERMIEVYRCPPWLTETIWQLFLGPPLPDSPEGPKPTQSLIARAEKARAPMRHIIKTEIPKEILEESSSDQAVIFMDALNSRFNRDELCMRLLEPRPRLLIIPQPEYREWYDPNDPQEIPREWKDWIADTTCIDNIILIFNPSGGALRSTVTASDYHLRVFDAIFTACKSIALPAAQAAALVMVFRDTFFYVVNEMRRLDQWSVQVKDDEVEVTRPQARKK